MPPGTISPMKLSNWQSQPTSLTIRRTAVISVKKSSSNVIQRRAQELGINTIIEGSNTDDLNDYRPGMRAAKELGMISPLLATGMDKETIRTLSQQAGLPTWNKPASACLLSRIPYHTKITPGSLTG